MENTKAIDKELSAIERAHAGFLKAEAVVNYARNPRTALHKRFEWDDTKAAHQHRLAQAREIIRTRIYRLETAGRELPMKVYVSLVPDQQQPGGGYRKMVDVLSDKAQREQLLLQCADDMRRFRARYQRLKEVVALCEQMHATEIAILKRTGRLPVAV